MFYSEFNAFFAHYGRFLLFKLPFGILIKIREPAVSLKFGTDARNYCLVAQSDK